MTERRRSTKAEMQQLHDQIFDLLAAEHPQSLRHVFYRMTDTTLVQPIEKTERGYNQVKRACAKLRQNETVPYSWIVDMTRRGYHVTEYANPGAFLTNMAGLYRGELWTPDLPHVEVWVESRSIASIVQTDCRELAVSLYPAGGYSSLSLIHSAAEEIANRARSRVVVYYVGDLDIDGQLIDKSIEAGLRSHLSIPLEIVRLGINEDQIVKYGLPTKPPKSTDKRRSDLKVTVEAETMPAGIMRKLVRDAVESHLPAGQLAAVKVAEKAERIGLHMLSGWVRKLGLEKVNNAAVKAKVAQDYGDDE